MRRKGLAAVGKSVPRLDAGDKVTGKSLYVADIRLPGMLQVKLVRCPHSHARIKRIDVGRAEKVAGVEAIITGKDLPGGGDSFAMAAEVVGFWF